MKKIVNEILPIITISESNTHEHWTKSHKRHREQKRQIRLAFLCGQWKIDLPCHVILTRLASRMLDDDNNISAFKWIRDAISEEIVKYDGLKFTKKISPGHADSDPRITWEYKQEKSKEKCIRLEIYT